MLYGIRLTSSGDCFGPFEAACAYDMFSLSDGG